ncbi:uncharacterized protein LOC111897790 [Lactuca sativa]|uniref:Senescence regulator S40 n=1 Tax=Lactuca sativa TaxID=4236 RepID=A0A9R1VCJ2_LACSA|nr:uncharacterized protein LOC111897790 [Lactuca sativa]KAJ0202215.1 hypothetical protein LSAT_V11C600316200 [Lactuca sativa]
MAASKSYYARSNFRYFSGERDVSIGTDSMFELDESDIWNVAASPELRKTVPSSRISKKSSAVVKREEIGGTASSLPVNVPDWSKILKEDYRDNRRRNDDEDDDINENNYGDDGTGNRIPPHEFLARQLARTRIASFSVHEGIGRTLKGRDLSRVRNAIWEKTGFQD